MKFPLPLRGRGIQGEGDCYYRAGRSNEGAMVASTTFRVRESRALNRARAKSMRHDPVYVERLFWSHIRDRKLGWKFRRQVLIGRYIADYVCAQKKVIVELDGGVHKLRREHDKKRDDYLRNRGYVVVRFENYEVLRDLRGVLAKILHVIETAPSPPTPLPPRGRGESLRKNT